MGGKPLYAHLIKFIPRLDCQAVYRTFVIGMKLQKFHSGSLSIFQYTLLDNFEDNPGFTVKTALNDARQGELTGRSAYSRLGQTQATAPASSELVNCLNVK